MSGTSDARVYQAPWCNRCGKFHDGTGCNPPEPPTRVTAPTWASVVAAVMLRVATESKSMNVADEVANAIGRGIAAALHEYTRTWCRGEPTDLCELAAVAAFREASKKEEG